MIGGNDQEETAKIFLFFFPKIIFYIFTKMAKESKKKEKKSESAAQEESLAPLAPQCSIASPLADAKLTKKLLKTVKKGISMKAVRRGVKEVCKSIRKGEKGLVVLAGDICPVDVISHLPVLCEDHQLPYIYVPSKKSLGEACSTKRPTSVILLKEQVKAKLDGEGAGWDELVSELGKRQLSLTVQAAV